MVTKGLLPALGYTFTLTFVIFPGVAQDTRFKFLNGRKNEESWFILTTLTLFNLCDTIGRSAAGYSCLTISRKAMLVISYARTIFLLLFFLTAF